MNNISGVKRGRGRPPKVGGRSVDKMEDVNYLKKLIKKFEDRDSIFVNPLNTVDLKNINTLLLNLDIECETNETDDVTELQKCLLQKIFITYTKYFINEITKD